MKTIHLRLTHVDQETVCGQDVKTVLWTTPYSAPELFDGEIDGIQPCPECVAQAAVTGVETGAEA